MSRIVERMMHYTTPDFITLLSPVLNYSMPIGSDAPFRLYGIAIFPIDGGLGNEINQLKMRFTRPDQSWAQRHLTPTFALAPGQPPTTALASNQPSQNYFLFSPISPNLVYPPSSVITIDIARIDGTAVALNCVVVFIGTNLYEEGRVWSPARSDRSRSIPYFGYNVLCNAQQLLGGIVRNVPLNIGPDADFIWQASVHTDIPVGQFTAFGVANGNAEVMFVATKLGTPPGDQVTPIPGQLNVAVLASAPFQAFSITVVGPQITINVATDGLSASISTADFVASQVNINPAVQALGVRMVVTNEGGSPPGIMPTTGPLPGNAFRFGGDGSFISSGQSLDGNLINLGIRVKDWTGKYYSNVLTTPQNQLAGFVPAAVFAGFNNGQLPGLVYPEIYLPRDSSLYFDFAMLDGSLNPNQQTPIVTLKGQKVYS